MSGEEARKHLWIGAHTLAVALYVFLDQTDRWPQAQGGAYRHLRDSGFVSHATMCLIPLGKQQRYYTMLLTVVLEYSKDIRQQIHPPRGDA